MKKFTNEFVKEFCLKLKIDVLDEYVECNKKLNLKCLVCDFIWKSSDFSHIKYRNQGCPKCYEVKIGHKRKNLIEDVKTFCLKFGIKCNSDKYINTKEHLDLTCLVCNNNWFTSFGAIKSGHSCPCCAHKLAKEKQREPIENVRNICLKSDINLISKEYINNREKLKYKCLKCQHEWEGNFDNIKNKHYGCPVCNQPGISQQKLFETLKTIYPLDIILFNYTKLDWFKNQRNLEIDILIKDKKIAIEYDGILHFKPFKIYGGEAGLKNQKIRDKLKNKLIESHIKLGGLDIKYFIRIPYWEPISKENIKRILEENKIPI